MLKILLKIYFGTEDASKKGVTGNKRMTQVTRNNQNHWMKLGKMTMKKIALTAAIAAALAAPSAFADVYVTGIDSFGTAGSTSDQPTDVSETLSVDGWSSAAVQAAVGAGAVLNSITVYVQASLSTAGTATNTGATAADAQAQVLALGGDWKVTSTDDPGISNTFAPNFSTILLTELGTVAPDQTVNFGPVTAYSTSTGGISDNAADFDWFAITLPNSMASLTTLSFLFETHTISTITGGSNFDSSFSTATYGAVYAEYDYSSAPPQVPTPAPLAMMGLGLLGLAARRRMKRS